MIRAIIIEDEQRNIDLLKTLIELHCADLVSMQGAAKNLPDAAALIREAAPDLIYLDIELNQGNAFQLLDGMDHQHHRIVFITAYNEYAVKAFRYNAVDYLLKPIDSLELRAATERAARRQVSSGDSRHILEAIQQLKATMGAGKVGLPVLDGVEFVNLAEVVKAEAKGSYSILHLANGTKITSTKNLKELELLLPDQSFLRVHHSWILNIRYLRKYYRGKSGYMEMEDGSVVPVSLRKKRNLLGFLSE